MKLIETIKLNKYRDSELQRLGRSSWFARLYNEP
jgi:hypothetical protein